MPYLLFLLVGECDDATSCTASGFFWGPILLVAVVAAGFFAGRLNRSTPIGLVAILAACGIIVGVMALTDVREHTEWESIQTWLAFTAIAFGSMVPGFLFGRDRHNRSEIARLIAQRAAGSISAEAFEQEAVRLGLVRRSDQAPPNHGCGRCGKPLSTVWRRKCQHCGATYAEFPPIPR